MKMAASGGCDPETLVPEGCLPCGQEAMIHCYSNEGKSRSMCNMVEI